MIPSALSTTLGKWRPIGLIVLLSLFVLQAVAASPHNATLDLGLAFFATFAIWRLWHVLERPSGLNVLLAGLGLGLALNVSSSPWRYCPVYGFQSGPIEGIGLPVPAPLYFESFIGMFIKSSKGRANFLDGQVSMAGWEIKAP